MEIYKEGKVEIIEYRDRKYKRYPLSSNRTDRRYFKRYVSKGINNYLHRDIYEDTYGSIPSGYIIHHKDGDYNNNSLNNLRCISKEENDRLHAKQYYEEHKEEILARLARVRPLAAEWRETEEGKAHYVRLGKESLSKRELKEYSCAICGKKYFSKGTKSLYCSTRCSSTANSRKRRESGIDVEKRVCCICGEFFQVEKSAKTVCCSRKCGAALRYRNRNKEQK